MVVKQYYKHIHDESEHMVWQVGNTLRIKAALIRNKWNSIP